MSLCGIPIALFKRNGNSLKNYWYFLTPEGRQIANLRDVSNEIDTDLLKEVLADTDVEYAVQHDGDFNLEFVNGEIEGHESVVYKK